MPEKADVCEELPAVNGALRRSHDAAAAAAAATGLGIASGSRTALADSGASVEMACEPGENHTSTLARPVFMIENIRTSKYDRCSDM